MFKDNVSIYEEGYKPAQLYESSLYRDIRFLRAFIGCHFDQSGLSSKSWAQVTRIVPFVAIAKIEEIPATMTIGLGSEGKLLPLGAEKKKPEGRSL